MGFVTRVRREAKVGSLREVALERGISFHGLLHGRFHRPAKETFQRRLAEEGDVR